MNCGADKVSALGEFHGFGDSGLSQDVRTGNGLPSSSSGNAVCYKCGEVIPADAKYCPFCSTLLMVSCPSCQKNYSTRFPSCPSCGVNRKNYYMEQKRREAMEAEKKRAEKERQELQRRQAEFERKQEEERKLAEKKREEEAFRKSEQEELQKKADRKYELEILNYNSNKEVERLMKAAYKAKKTELVFGCIFLVLGMGAMYSFLFDWKIPFWIVTVGEVTFFLLGGLFLAISGFGKSYNKVYKFINSQIGENEYDKELIFELFDKK